MMNSSETFGNNRNGEAPELEARFGESLLSDPVFEPREFPDQAPDETERQFAEREMRADERIFMVGLIKAESQGPDGMVEALNAPDFRIKRSQKREFLEAIGKMSEEEYGTRVNDILGVFDTPEARDAAMDIADYYWLSAKKKAKDVAALDETVANDNVERTHHEKPRKYRWKVEEKPEMPKSQAEVMLANPQKYYREQKQERRGKKLFDKIKGVFNKLKEEKIPRRARSGVSPSDFSDEPLIPTPQLNVATRENVGRRIEDDGSMEVSGGDYPAPVPAGKLFRGTNFYQETPAGHYFGGGESPARDVVPESAIEGAMPESMPEEVLPMKDRKARWRDNLSSARFDGLNEFGDNGGL